MRMVASVLMRVFTRFQRRTYLGQIFFPSAMHSAVEDGHVHRMTYRVHMPANLFTKLGAYKACGDTYSELYGFPLHPINVCIKKDQKILHAATYLYT